MHRIVILRFSDSIVDLLDCRQESRHEDDGQETQDSATNYTRPNSVGRIIVVISDTRGWNNPTSDIGWKGPQDSEIVWFIHEHCENSGDGQSEHEQRSNTEFQFLCTEIAIRASSFVVGILRAIPARVKIICMSLGANWALPRH